MKQFYEFLADSSMYNVGNFTQPVRKICIVSNKDASIRLCFSGGQNSDAFRIFAKTPTHLDFQSANNGGGVSGLEFKGTTESGSSTLYVSVEEYATGGNNDWYK